jgi:hypothetical protein
MRKSKSSYLFFSLFITVFWIITSNLTASESQLSKLMRVMANDFKTIKTKLVTNGNIPEYHKNYKKILSAKASADSKKGEHYAEYAQLFLKQYDRFYSCEKLEQKKEFNNLISTCIRCHETYCPGPLTMIKKMKISPE